MFWTLPECHLLVKLVCCAFFLNLFLSALQKPGKKKRNMSSSDCGGLMDLTFCNRVCLLTEPRGSSRALSSGQWAHNSLALSGHTHRKLN